MVASYTEDFEVTWAEPSDGALSWAMDPMHFPHPLPALTQGVVKSAMEGIFGARATIVNGYLYLNNYGPPPPTEEVMRRGAADIWLGDYQHRVREATERIRAANYDSMTATELAAALPGIIRDAMEAFRYTMVVVFGFMGPTMALMDFMEQELGPEGGHLLTELLQGFENESAAAGAGLSDLATTAAGLPEVARALREGRFGDLGSVAGGAEFLAKFDAYLNDYGWRAETWSLAHVPTWTEKPETALMLISRYLVDPARSPAAAIERAVKQREAAEQRVRSHLSGEKLAQFETMLAAAQKHVAVSEGRALWQLIIIGSLRVPVLALGRKLVAAGALDDPNDAFYFTLDELQAMARSPSATTKEEARARKALLARQEAMRPPPFIGAPPSMDGMPPEALGIVRRFFGLGVTPSEQRNVIKGNPASKGVHRGRARIIRSLSEAGALQAGDVLVCGMTAPPWTPLFAIAGAVVTDTGGILSHSAICAREYAIPCVVGTMFATQAIPDGAMVTVDGGAGTVTIEG